MSAYAAGLVDGRAEAAARVAVLEARVVELEDALQVAAHASRWQPEVGMLPVEQDAA